MLDSDWSVGFLKKWGFAIFSYYYKKNANIANPHFFVF